RIERILVAHLRHQEGEELVLAVLVVDGQGAGRAGARTGTRRARPVGIAGRTGAASAAGGTLVPRSILQGAGEGIARVRLRTGRHGGLVRHEPGHRTSRGIGDRLRKSEHRGSYSPIRSVLSISWRAVRSEEHTSELQSRDNIV